MHDAMAARGATIGSIARRRSSGTSPAEGEQTMLSSSRAPLSGGVNGVGFSRGSGERSSARISRGLGFSLLVSRGLDSCLAGATKLMEEQRGAGAGGGGMGKEAAEGEGCVLTRQ